jgi:hypothetical protein
MLSLPGSHGTMHNGVGDDRTQPLSRTYAENSPVDGIKLLSVPSQILCDHPQDQHIFMLSSDQFC